MKRKKIMTILFGTVICASLALTACGESGSSGRGTRPRDESGEEEDDEDEEKDRDEKEEDPDEDKPENGSGKDTENGNTGSGTHEGREDAGNGGAGNSTGGGSQVSVEYNGMEFKTTDLDGNQVSARDLFSAHEYTMVNVWASWCGPCVGEIPDLAELNESWEQKDCAIVGILLDGSDPYGLQDGKEILRDAGADYLNLIPNAEMERIFSVEVVPTSFFVDRSGHIVGDTIEGAWPEGYEMTINELLGN